MRIVRALGAILAGALGGFAAVEGVVPTLLTTLRPDAPMTGERLALGFMVVLIASLLLLLGDLLPKALVIHEPEANPQRGVGILDRLKRAGSMLRHVLLLARQMRQIVLRPRQVGAPSGAGLRSPWHLRDAWLEKDESTDPGQASAVRSQLRTAFPEVQVREVMVPRFKIQALPLDSTPDAILGYLLAHHGSRYPVYGQSLDDIHGILYLKDVFEALARHELLDLARVVRPALMVPETLPVGCLFERFQRERVQMAVVANEYGALCGVVTLEDLVEQIVGAIADEFDEEDVMIERLDDQALLVDGAFFVRDLNRLCGFAIPESTVYATLGGFLLTLFQHLPREGEVVAHGEYTYTIVRMDGRRVAKARAARMTQDGDGEAKVE